MSLLKLKNQSKGFTLIELVMVIVILGVLAIVAVPKFFDLSDQAKQSAEKGVVGGVRSGITTYFANHYSYPPALDSSLDGDCTANNICFDIVLDQGGITQDWQKSGNVYSGPTGVSYVYDPDTGSFQEQVIIPMPPPLPIPPRKFPPVVN